MISYDQKASAYWQIIMSKPNISANEVGRQFKGTEYGMRKEDRNQLIRHLKDADQYRNATKESYIPKEGKDRMIKGIYQRAKKTTDKYLKTHPPKKGTSKLTPKEMYKSTFGQGDKPNDFKERY